MFAQDQIQEFKEAFNMIDQNRDGFIDRDDLHDTLASLGKDPSDKYLEDMMNEAPGPINFTMFLTMFGEKLNGTDPEDVIKNAVACFDDDNTVNLNTLSLSKSSNTAKRIRMRTKLKWSSWSNFFTVICSFYCVPSLYFLITVNHTHTHTHSTLNRTAFHIN